MKTCLLRRLYLLLFIFLGSLLLNLQPIHAQTTTTLSIQPSLVEVGMGGQISLSMDVTGGVSVNAYDIILEYDSTRLELTNWTHGGFLSNLAIVVRTQNPGYFRLVCTQLATPPVSGDGVLLNLTFTTLAPGLSNIEITGAEFADSSGNKTLPTRANAQIQIDANPVNTSTPTATRTATITPTLPVVPSATQATLTATQTSPGVPTATYAFTPTTSGNVTSTRSVNPNTTPQAQLTPTLVVQPTAMITATVLQNASVATPTTGVTPGSGQQSTLVSGLITDPIVIPVRPENSSSTEQTEDKTKSDRYLDLGIVLSAFIGLGLIVFVILKRGGKIL